MSKSSPCLPGNRRPRRTIIRVLLVLLLVPLLLQWVLAYLIGGDTRLLPPELLHARNLLFVTAHPEDESRFLAPSILGVLDRNPNITGGLLVMSTGVADNNVNIAEKRKQQLEKSCEALRIERSRCVAIDHFGARNSPGIQWDKAAIRATLEDYVESSQVDAIVTFDERGRSIHNNHRVVGEAVSDFVRANDKAIPAFKLVTTSTGLGTYDIVLNLPLTALRFLWRILAAIFYPSTKASSQHSSKALIASTWRRYLMTRRALGSYDSQRRWSHHFYLIFSKYVWFNELQRINPWED